MNAKRILQLPTVLANQIAAGEVIERPASVLKELLENSLDAGSTQIDISVEKGGLSLIQVQDNGVGICKDDLKLAIAAHATSKIETLSDLEGVATYGFRGEALASISAVSRLKLSSWVSNQDYGWCVQLEGRGGEAKLMPVPKRPGTLLEVKDLFYNTPARRNFLRSEKTETAYLEETFKQIALSQPAIAFRFFRGERYEKRLPACRNMEAQTRRIAVLCGQNFVENSYFVQAESNGLKLSGWLGSARALRSQADLQYFYVNGRIVRDKVVMHAVRQAYQEMCLPGRYPAYVLYFECDPASVDVNVHPTKHEVRFREARTVHAFLSYAIQEALKQGSVSNASSKLEAKEKGMNKEMDFEFLDRVPSFPSELAIHSPSTQAVSQLGREFMLAENEGGLMIVDLKATRRLLMSEVLKEGYLASNILKRPLLMPKPINLGKQIKNLNSSVIDWANLGFEFTEIGQNSVLLRSVPAVFGSKVEDLTEFLQKLLALSTVDHCIDLMVDHVVNSQPLSEEENKQLLIEMEKSISLKNKKEEGKFRKYCRQFTVEQFRETIF